MKIKQAFYRLRYFVKNDVAKFLIGVFADKHLKDVKIIIRIFYEENVAHLIAQRNSLIKRFEVCDKFILKFR
jgi:hypothetical protein